MRAAWLERGLAILLTLVTVAACGVSGTALRAASAGPAWALPAASGPDASPGPARAVPATFPAPVVMSNFAGLVVAHPAAWRQYFLSPGDSLQPQAAGYLTNEPITAGCGATPGRTVVCGQPVTTMDSGGVYITVNLLYQAPVPLPQANATIGGYPADVVTGADPGTYGCPAATTQTVAATLSRTDVQPSQVWIFACLGGADNRRAQQQVMSMLNSARITARPPAIEPVPGEPLCTSQDLAVEPGPRLSPATGERGLIYAVRNIGHRTCRISGYPAVQLFAGTTRLPLTYQDGGGPYLLPGPAAVLYLRPAEYATFQIVTSACVAAAGTTATTVEITLPDQTVATSRSAGTPTGPGAVGYCSQPGQLVYISALTAY